MRLREGNVGARRIPVVVHSSSTGLVAAGCAPSASQLFVSVNGEAWREAGGTLVDRGDGSYYYQATLDEASTLGVLCVMVKGVAGYRTEMAWAPVGDSTTVRVPIVVYDTTGDLYPGFAPSGSELQTSTGGGAFVDATGDWLEMGFGGYVYAHDRDVASTSFVVVKAQAGAIQTALAHGVGGGSDVETGTPVEGTYELAEIEPVDHLAAALARLCEQFKTD